MYYAYVTSRPSLLIGPSVNKLDSLYLSYIDSCTLYSLIKIIIKFGESVANGEMGVANQKWAWPQNFLWVLIADSVPTYTYIHAYILISEVGNYVQVAHPIDPTHLIDLFNACACTKHS